MHTDKNGLKMWPIERSRDYLFLFAIAEVTIVMVPWTTDTLKSFQILNMFWITTDSKQLIQ